MCVGTVTAWAVSVEWNADGCHLSYVVFSCCPWFEGWLIHGWSSCTFVCLHLITASDLPLDLPTLSVQHVLRLPLVHWPEVVPCVISFSSQFPSLLDQSKKAFFLANVNVSSRSLYAIARPSVVCLSSVTFVRPTQALEIFRNIYTALGTLAIRWHPPKMLWRSSQGNPSVGGAKHNRGS